MMNKFSISVNPRNEHNLAPRGMIVIDDFRDHIQLSCEIIKISDYRNLWREAYRIFKETGYSSIITSISSDGIDFWPFEQIGENIVFIYCHEPKKPEIDSHMITILKERFPEIADLTLSRFSVERKYFDQFFSNHIDAA